MKRSHKFILSGLVVAMFVFVLFLATTPSAIAQFDCPQRTCSQSATCPNGGTVECSFEGRSGGNCFLGSQEVFCSDGSVKRVNYVACYGRLCNGTYYSVTNSCTCSGSGGGGGPGDVNPE